MTIGIYRLIFNGTDKTYIGQSVRIEVRYLEHLRNIKNGSANTKLLEANKLYGNPELDIILECPIEELDTWEDEAIEIFNSVDNGFNLYKYSNQAPSYTGEYGYGNTKYSKDQIIDSFNLLVDRPDLSYTDISKITNVTTAVVSSISNLSTHTWLSQEYPSRYEVLRNMLGTRGNKSSTVVSEKLSAKSQGIIYPVLYDPQGNAYIIENAYKFAREHGLAGNHLTEVLNGHRKSHKGWKICQDE